MLKHPANYMNSSALGRYQIVRTTLRNIRNTLNLEGSLLFNEELQDKCACYLLGVRRIDKWIAGRLSDDTMLNNLARSGLRCRCRMARAHMENNTRRLRLRGHGGVACVSCPCKRSETRSGYCARHGAATGRKTARLAGWIAAAITAIGAMVAAKYGGKFW